MPRMIDIGGRVYGKLTALSFVRSEGKNHYWSFQCECGAVRIIPSRYAVHGHSIGCEVCQLAHKESVSRKHGHGAAGNSGKTRSKTYTSWMSAKARCYNTNSDQFADYGARGITMCQEWKEDFRHFLADMGERPDGMTLERIDSNGNYEKNNCIWATQKSQQNNKRSNVVIFFRGERLTLAQFARRNGLIPESIRNRMKTHGESAERAAEVLRRTSRKPCIA